MRVSLPSLLLATVLPAFAWDGTGHRICAAITYDRLTPKARARVDELLRHHPDYTTLLTKDAPDDPAARARDAFLTAATWPDLIRSDPRFYDDTNAKAAPTAPVPGFPDMKRHTNWHYIDIPYSPQGVPAKVEPPPTALSELERILRDFRSHAPDSDLAYELPWLLHLEEDVHQPLHDISRFLIALPKGDQGGNLVYVVPVEPQRNGRTYQTLHAVWDDAAGTNQSDAYVSRSAAEITADYVGSHGPNPKTSKDPRKWVLEGYRLAKRAVYTFGFDSGSREMPIKLPSNYAADASRVARKQIAEAGFRMAAILNELFQ